MRVAAIVLGLLFAFGAQAQAAPGDTYEVTTGAANLRAGASDQSEARAEVQNGERLLELQRSGRWYGVRSLKTGEEGWIFEDLVERVAKTKLGSTAVGGTAGLAGYSESLDAALARISAELGYPVVEDVEEHDGLTLEITASDVWLRRASIDSHAMAALAFYEMWKTVKGTNKVRLLICDAQGIKYVEIDNTGENGPVVSFEAVHPLNPEDSSSG